MTHWMDKSLEKTFSEAIKGDPVCARCGRGFSMHKDGVKLKNRCPSSYDYKQHWSNKFVFVHEAGVRVG